MATPGKSSPTHRGRVRTDAEGWTAQQRLFVSFYLKHRRADRAIAQAGYSVPMETQNIAGRILLKKPHIAAFVKDHDDAVIARNKFDGNRVLDELAKVGTASLSTFCTFNQAGECIGVDFANASDADLAAIQEIKIETYMDGRGDGAREVKTVKIKFHSKMHALELLGKNLKLFTDRIEHTGEITILPLPGDDKL